jgi:hypothetical protein
MLHIGALGARGPRFGGALVVLASSQAARFQGRSLATLGLSGGWARAR